MPGAWLKVTASYSASWHPKGQTVPSFLARHPVRSGVDSWHGIILGRRALPMMSPCHPCCGKAVTRVTAHPHSRNGACAQDTFQLLIPLDCRGSLVCAHTPKHTGSINWHSIPSVLMKCPFCLRILNLKLNSSWAVADG